MSEITDLYKFYIGFQEEIKSQLVADDEGNTPEQIFTDLALSLLAEGGETENYLLKFDEKLTGRGVEHKINAYALSENYETLDIFVTIYNGTDSISVVSKTDADKALDRLVKFFRNAIYKDYVKYIEESSQIFDLAHTLANSSDIKEYLTRVNVFVLTDGEIKSEISDPDKIAGYKTFKRVIDINYLYNISKKTHIPIEINFQEKGIEIPCIEVGSKNSEYQSYLAIFPGIVLASIYEDFGSRLLEQNVRSFLQFSGKINKGIRTTIMEEPHMFLAYNNGIAATAEEVILGDSNDGKGKIILSVKDLQIVNGGQTTASIYHTWKKDKADISQIAVQVKLSKVTDQSKFGVIVSRISECANTQNKVTGSDLSSNKPFHIELEKLSRSIWAPPISGSTQQTNWFYERARGQYKNAANKYGFTPAKRKSFELRNPKNQVLTKEDIAKYNNNYQEIFEKGKLVIGPHVVVRGNQKNYVEFMKYNSDFKPNNVYFEDLIATAILFKSVEKVYGVRPNAIGDMRYITVPYAIAWFGFNTDYNLDLYKIWKNQSISEELKKLFHKIMLKVEDFIKKNAPGSLYGEWAKREECWNLIKNNNLGISVLTSGSDFTNKTQQSKRKIITDSEIVDAEQLAQLERINSIPYRSWKAIENWGRESGELSAFLSDVTSTVASRLRSKHKLREGEMENAIKILDIAIDKASDIFYNVEELMIEEDLLQKKLEVDPEINLELINQMVAWDKKNKRLRDYEFKFMLDLAEGRKALTDKNIFIVRQNLKKIHKFGF